MTPRLQLVRHATLKIEIAGMTLLVDPMLAEVASTPPIQNGPDDRKNPLVPLPMSIDELLNGVSAVVVTHTHRDHWDATASEVIPKHLPIYCQPEDEQTFRNAGFANVHPVGSRLLLSEKLEIIRTGGQHGTGEIGKKMAPVSGYVLRGAGIATYIAGDTIWCEEVRRAISEIRPATIVVNAGGARFIQGNAITMTPQDVAEVCQAAVFAKVIAVHMEAINHCLVTRGELAKNLESSGLLAQVRMPANGEWVELDYACDWFESAGNDRSTRRD